MNKFKPGDIVRCLSNNPRGARIQKGELALISEVAGEGLRFDNYPTPFKTSDITQWFGRVWDFELADYGITENE